MTEPRYVFNNQGERVSVLLDIETYQSLLDPETSDRLAGLSETELKALANLHISSETQKELADLSKKNKITHLDSSEALNYDALLEQIDTLNILKARARLTLKQQTQAA